MDYRKNQNKRNQTNWKMILGAFWEMDTHSYCINKNSRGRRIMNKISQSYFNNMDFRTRDI